MVILTALVGFAVNILSMRIIYSRVPLGAPFSAEFGVEVELSFVVLLIFTTKLRHILWAPTRNIKPSNVQNLFEISIRLANGKRKAIPAHLR